MARGPLSALPTWSLLAIAIIPALAYLLATLAVRMPTPLHLAAMAAIIVWALVFSMQWYNRLDEVAHEAQKSAATWGGSFGLVAGLILTTLLAFSPGGSAWIADYTTWLSQHARTHVSPTSLAFSFGALVCCMTFVVGFLLAWAGWWIRKR